MNRLPQQPDLTPTALFNPSLKHFSFTYDKKEYTLSALGIAVFPKYIAQRLAARLADEIISLRGVKQNFELDKQELLKKIYIK